MRQEAPATGSAGNEDVEPGEGGGEEDLEGLLGRVPLALGYLLAILVFFGLVLWLTRLLVPGPLQS